jgi:ABC-type nitrate/sulfonate/bicarbonate transport system ATPase subunit
VEIDIRSKRFPAVGAAEARLVLENLRLSLRFGDFVGVFGPSGCGKTTLLNIVAGLDPDFQGSVHLAPADRGGIPVIGYVFQNPRLLPWRTVEENVRLVLPSHPATDDRVGEILDAVGLTDARHVYPNRLSVGMSRRAALARAFVIEPELLLMDEPFVSIDVTAANRLRRLLLSMLDERPTTVLFVTHDLREAISLADRIAVISAPPAAVVADVAVDIPRDQRTGDAVERFRARLLDECGKTLRAALDPEWTRKGTSLEERP